jgi:hypothetical protein
VTSQPAGIDCVFTATETTGTCGDVVSQPAPRSGWRPVPAQGSSFLGWEFETTCRDAPKVTVAAGVAHICRPVFRLK